jgi:hypothetical protein
MSYHFVTGGAILSGTGTPAANVGSAGDFFLDTSTGDLYGPKAQAGWPVDPTQLGATMYTDPAEDPANTAVAISSLGDVITLEQTIDGTVYSVAVDAPATGDITVYETIGGTLRSFIIQRTGTTVSGVTAWTP